MSLPSIHVGLATLKVNPLRTMLSTLGVIIGAGSLVAVLSLGDGAGSFARRGVRRAGCHPHLPQPPARPAPRAVGSMAVPGPAWWTGASATGAAAGAAAAANTPGANQTRRAVV